MNNIQTLLCVVCFLGFIALLVFDGYLDTCAESEYFFVADSIVYPAGDNLEEAMTLSTRDHVRYSDGRQEYSTRTFIGKKARCAEIQVW